MQQVVDASSIPRSMVVGHQHSTYSRQEEAIRYSSGRHEQVQQDRPTAVGLESPRCYIASKNKTAPSPRHHTCFDEHHSAMSIHFRLFVLSERLSVELPTAERLVLTPGDEIVRSGRRSSHAR